MKKHYSIQISACIGVILASIYFTKLSFAENLLSIPVSTGDEISVERFPASGKSLILWLAPEYGFRGAHRAMAQAMQNQNIEVWQADILESLFLPLSTNAIKKLNGERVADLIEQAHKISGKKIIIAADSYASINALKGAHQWQQRKHVENYLMGAILFSPNTYQSIPPLGQLPQYMPIVSATNIPLMIYQAKGHGNMGQFKSLIKKLQQHGNAVYSQIVEKTSIRFYENKPDKKSRRQFHLLAKNIKMMISILEKEQVPEKPVALKNENKNNNNGIDIYLKAYKGSITPKAINLTNAYGQKVIKNNFKGKVTVINFWATWCPPCVKEIPSLNRLNKKMKGQAFELISINYAEDRKTILDFMKKVKVDFPVLLDPNGSFAKKWNVIAYPSTFVIDSKGNIKYGVNAAIEWDKDDVIKQITSLM